MKKTYKIMLMVILIIGGTAIAINFGTQNEILPVGSALPEIKIVSLSNTVFIKTNNKPLMIMYFKPDCAHCRYELDLLNKRIDELSFADIYLLTTDRSFFTDSLFRDYKNLINKVSIKFGLASENEYKKKFGITSTPVFYFFDRHGRLAEKIIGETRFDRIHGSIKNAGGAQRRQSGTN